MKLWIIFLSSFLQLACDGTRVPIVVLDAKNGVIKNRTVTGVNEKTGEFILERKPDLILKAETIDGLICTTPGAYNWGNMKFKDWWLNVR
jgi:hypothetical protein